MSFLIPNLNDAARAFYNGAVPATTTTVLSNTVTASGTVITVPFPRTWVGSITIDAHYLAAGSTSSATVKVVTPAGCVPSSITLAQVSLQPGSTAATDSSVHASVTVPNVTVIANTTDVIVASSNGGAGASLLSVTAIGNLI